MVESHKFDSASISSVMRTPLSVQTLLGAMRIHYLFIGACGVLNTAINAYGARTSTYTPPTWLDAVFGPALTWALLPCGLMVIAAYNRKFISFFLVGCAVLTLLSGFFWGYLYVTETDSSRIFLLGAHWFLTFIFAVVSLFAPREKPHA